jgi:hypothetical protein
MLNCAKLERQPRVFQSLTGFSLVVFAQLLSAFEQAYATAQDTAAAQREQACERQRGGGRKATLATLADKLLFILFYFRLYPTQAAQGFFFGISQGQACTWIHRLTPVLHQALGSEQQLPARQPAAVTQILAACPDLAFIVDGPERPIQRPQAAERQRQYYSGKKKRHTVKNIVITHQGSRKSKALGPTREGKKHDKAAVDETNFLFPPGSRLWKDSSFQGYEPAGITTCPPKKKPRGGELAPGEQEPRQTIARERIGVEHSIGGTKVFRIMHDVFRNPRPAFDDLGMATACGLFNLRLDFRRQVA